MEQLQIDLNRDPAVQLSCTFIKAAPGAPLRTLIIFLNGVDCPQSSWYPLMSLISQQSASRNSPPILMYDRVGQGKSSSGNSGKRDVLDAVYDLRGLIEKIGEMRLGVSREEVNALRLCIVASSVGCHIARLYAQTFPKTVGGLLLLDPIIADKDILSLFPNPIAPGYNKSTLPGGISCGILEQTRRKLESAYHPMGLNREGLWLGNIQKYFPLSHLPKLVGPKPNTPCITVILHNPEIFARQMKEATSVDETLIRTYLIPAWHQNGGALLNITAEHLRRGPITAEGSGHLVHLDDPRLVVNEMGLLLGKLRQSVFSFLKTGNTTP
ncbi:hypothetical protein B0O99DRAFT_603047 [Bisporella sp. PMI_857]|nr:hypothetical protein B0O99DRAFT_603047 [Bisporella sp. PMI_857]